MGTSYIQQMLMSLSVETYAIIGVFLLIFVILLIIIIRLNLRVKKLEKKFKNLLSNSEGVSLERVLFDYIEKLNELVKKNHETENKINELERNQALCIKKIGLVRYNAFENVGSDLSFAIAALDDNDDGFVINGIYSRENSVVYAKPIVSGNSKYVLSAEEIQAIDRAKKSVVDRLSLGGKENERK